ncbi:MAG: hypothetical protein ACREPD_09340 [Stenotrophomonas sp.]|uniref:hypothetical protein n=1 Tax=Stenotrophomonas sp. TaxID=69392 RepID=UPI003D6CB3EF
MKFHVDFSIYASPVDAYGNATGYVDPAYLPAAGDKFKLLSETEAGPALLLRVDKVRSAEGEEVGSIALEDHVVEGRDVAEALSRRLANETSLFVYVY